MTDRSRIALCAVVGAVAGGLGAFFLFTDTGRRARAELAPRLDDLAKDVRRLGELAQRIRDVAAQSRGQVETFVSELVERGGAGVSDARRR
jgi:hypothetical protein